jgi:hypothetical protein
MNLKLFIVSGQKYKQITRTKAWLDLIKHLGAYKGAYLSQFFGVRRVKRRQNDFKNEPSFKALVRI